jgi:hypothetical protein
MMKGRMRDLRNSLHILYRIAASSCVDVMMEEGLEILLNPLFISGQLPTLMLRMRGCMRGW